MKILAAVRQLISVLAVTLLVIFSFIMCWLTFATTSAINSFTELARFDANLTLKHATVDNIRLPYLTNSNHQKPTIVMFHGFGGGKDHWLAMADDLTDDYHLIVPDVPGFGDSVLPADFQQKSFTVNEQVKRLHSLLKLLAVDKAHIAGYSMGGNLALSFAKSYPDMVETLYLIAPAGVLQADDSRFMQILSASGENRLIAKDLDSFQRMMYLVFNDPPWLPSSVQAYYSQKAAKRYQLNLFLFSELTNSITPALSTLANAEMPVLVHWGRQDRVLDVSGARLIKKLNRPNIRVNIYQGLSHGLLFTDAGMLTQDYQQFLTNQHKPN
jgi:abhydrolase domain-containing protein 6